MRDYAAITTLVTERLQSAGTMDYSVSEVDNAISNALSEISTYYPHLVTMSFDLESRKGTDVTGTTGKLTDTVQSHFLSSDATQEKVVHNTTDNLWAVCTARDSASVLSLSNDIFLAQESYEIYNKQCWNQRQVYIGDVPNYENIHSVEFPIGTRRSWTRYDKVLEVDVDNIPDSSISIHPYGNVTVIVRFNQPHTLPNLTDWVGYVAATAAVSATAVSASALQTAGTLVQGTEFNIQYHMTTYIVANNTTIAASTAVIPIYPPLESAVSSTTWAINIRKSSLEPQNEDIFADLCAARLAINKANKLYSQANSTIVTMTLAASALSSMTAQIAAATIAIASGTTSMAGATTLAASALAVAGSADAQIALASSAMTSAVALFNTITVDDNPQQDWMNAAQVRLGEARSILGEAGSYLSMSNADGVISGEYGAIAMRDLSIAGQYMNQAGGYFRQIATQIGQANAGRLYESWGQNKLSEVLTRLRRTLPPKTSRRYSTE